MSKPLHEMTPHERRKRLRARQRQTKPRARPVLIIRESRTQMMINRALSSVSYHTYDAGGNPVLHMRSKNDEEYVLAHKRLANGAIDWDAAKGVLSRNEWLHQLQEAA